MCISWSGSIHTFTVMGKTGSCPDDDQLPQGEKATQGHCCLQTVDSKGESVVGRDAGAAGMTTA